METKGYKLEYSGNRIEILKHLNFGTIRGDEFITVSNIEKRLVFLMLS